MKGKAVTMWSRSLNAPEGYGWTDADVRFEKKDSWLDGVMVGWAIGLPLGALIAALIIR